MNFNKKARSKTASLFIAAGFFVFLSGCASSPDGFNLGSVFFDSIAEINQSIDRAAEVITPEQEYYIGRAVAANILTRYSLASSPQTEKYLNNICAVIVLNSAKPELFKGYHVGIMDTPEINAFASLGGHILISRGLLECTDSEDTIAAIIAHEIAHIQLQHSIKAIKSGRAVDAIFKTAQTALAASGQGDLQNLTDIFGDSINEIIGQMVEKGYSKTQEYEADKTALKLMSDAGYMPHAMIPMLNLLNTKLGSANTGFGKTHPSPKSRLKQVEKNLKKYPADFTENTAGGELGRSTRFRLF